VISGFTKPCRPGGSEGVRRRSPNWFLINATFLDFRLVRQHTFRTGYAASDLLKL
jgi:hypothetical protein